MDEGRAWGLGPFGVRGARSEVLVADEDGDILELVPQSEDANLRLDVGLGELEVDYDRGAVPERGVDLLEESVEALVVVAPNVSGADEGLRVERAGVRERGEE